MSSNNELLLISDRGQITIPKKLRSLLRTQYVECSFSEGNIILAPVQTRDEFLNELESAHKDWKKSGGKDLAAIAKEYDL